MNQNFQLNLAFDAVILWVWLHSCVIVAHIQPYCTSAQLVF